MFQQYDEIGNVMMAGSKSKQSINLRVRFFGHLKQTAGQPELDIEIQAGSTVSNAIQALVSSLGEPFWRSILDHTGKLQGGIEIVLNQEHLPARKIESILIENDSEMLIMPMIEGGSVHKIIYNIHLIT